MIGRNPSEGETLSTEREVGYCTTSDGVNIAGDLAGATVILASRIAAKTVGGEILVAGRCVSHAPARPSSSLTAASSWPRGSRNRRRYSTSPWGSKTCC